MPAAIEAEQLRKHYPPDVQALDGVSLNVEAGDHIRRARPRTAPGSRR